MSAHASSAIIDEVVEMIGFDPRRVPDPARPKLALFDETPYGPHRNAQPAGNLTNG